MKKKEDVPYSTKDEGQKTFRDTKADETQRPAAQVRFRQMVRTEVEGIICSK